MDKTEIREGMRVSFRYNVLTHLYEGIVTYVGTHFVGVKVEGRESVPINLRLVESWEEV